MGSTLERIHELENHFITFVENNTEVSDFILKTEYKSFMKSDEDPVMDFSDLIDNLICEKRIKRVYEKGSQVPFYKLAG